MGGFVIAYVWVVIIAVDPFSDHVLVGFGFCLLVMGVFFWNCKGLGVFFFFSYNAV